MGCCEVGKPSSSPCTTDKRWGPRGNVVGPTTVSTGVLEGKAQAHTPVMLAMKWLLFNPVSKHGTHPKKALLNRDGTENIYLSSWNIQTWIASLKNNYSCLLWQTWKSSTLRKKIRRVKADDDVVKLSIKQYHTSKLLHSIPQYTLNLNLEYLVLISISKNWLGIFIWPTGEFKWQELTKERECPYTCPYTFPHKLWPLVLEVYFPLICPIGI